MRGEKLRRAQDAAVAVLNHLDDRDSFAVVSYARDVRVDVPAQSAGNRKQIIARIRKIEADGDSALFGGISRAAAELRKHAEPQYLRRIVILSDGIANIGPNSPDILGRLATGLQKEGISITTVGLGADYSEDVMTRLSEHSHGNTYFAESSKELPQILSSELEGLLDIVTRDVNVTLNFPPGVTPLRVINGNGQIRGQQIETSFDQLGGGESRNVLLEAMLPPGAAGTTMIVARASISADDVLTGKQQLTDSQATINYHDEEIQTGPQGFNGVLLDNAFFLNAAAQIEAVDFADKGQPLQAVQTLKSSMKNLQQVASNAPAPQRKRAEKKVQQIEQQVEGLEQNDGLTAENRKRLVTDSAQERTQQRSR